MNVTIRSAVPDDAAAIRKLNLEAMGYDYPLDDTVSQLQKLLRSKQDRIFVAVAEHTVIGYIHACGYDLTYGPHLKNIMGIAVSAPFRRKGVGETLLREVEQWAKQEGASGIRLVSGAQRLDAHAFYHKCGYGGDKTQLNLKKMF